MIPTWMTDLSIASLCLGAACALVIAFDEIRRPQRMWIMNLVWPITALFGSLWIVWQYFAFGRGPAQADGSDKPKEKPPFAVLVANGALHCGSGCALGDICAEWLVALAPVVAIAFGWKSLFADRIFAVWIVDYLFAFGFGVLFQYFTIAPMRGLSFWPGILAAVKADALSLTSWQVGMYGFMAIAYFLIFRLGFGVRLEADTVEFWFMMQIAMLFGFATAFPVNWFLLNAGFKEPM
jgi:hypothetical protein